MQNAIEIRTEKSPASGFDSEEDKASLLRIENELLKEKLGLSGFCSYFAKEMNPLSLNRFLNHMLFMEDIGPQKPIRSDCFQKEYCETRKELWPGL